MADWSHLPKELLLLIAKGLQTHFDLLHFRAVCPNWRASAPFSLRPPPFHSPVLLGTDEDDGEKLFLFKRTVCLLEFPSNNSQTTPLSRLVMLEEDVFGKRHILHPFWRCKRKLVRHPKILLDISKLHVQELGHEYVVQSTDHRGKITDIEKTAYIDDDSHGMLLAIVKDESQRELYVLKPGDETATEVEVEGWRRWEDGIQFKRKFYVVDHLGRAVYVEPSTKAVIPVARALAHLDYNRLVESCGSLLMVGKTAARIYTQSQSTRLYPSKFEIEVYELDEQRKKWVYLKSLGDRILFLGKYCNFSAPAIPGVQGNRIVYSEDAFIAHCEKEKVRDNKAYVFDLKSHLTTPLACRLDLLQLFRPPFS